MLSSLRLQVFYSLLGLLLFAAFPWLLFVIYSLSDVPKLGQIAYFEAGRALTFPVNVLSRIEFNTIRGGYPAAVFVFLAATLPFFKTEFQKIPASLRSFFGQLLKFTRQKINSLTKPQKFLAGLTFLLIFAERIYFLFQYPIHTDEAATYFLFIQHGPFAIASFYPAPNNHVLQNLLAWPLTLFFREPMWVLRLPPLFFSLCLTFLGFLFLKRFAGFLTAYLASALFGFGSFTLFLAVQGRGYTLLTLLTVLSVAFLFRALKHGRAGSWVAFSLMAALGFYAVPTFAYPFAVCLAFAGLYLLFQKQWRQIPNLLLAALTTLMASLILYAPLLLISGSEALFGNRYLNPLTLKEFSEKLPIFLLETQGILLGDKFGIGIKVFYVSAALLTLIFIFRKRAWLKKYLPAQSNWLIGLVLLTSVAVYGLMRFQLLLPPPRVVFFKSFFDYLGVALVLTVILKMIIRHEKIRLAISFLLVLIFAGTQVSATQAFLLDYPQQYYTSPKLIRQIQEANARRVYVEEPFYQLFLEYEYARSGREIKIENEVLQPGQPYDFVVLEHQKPFPPALPDSLYDQVYQDELVKAYRPKVRN